MRKLGWTYDSTFYDTCKFFLCQRSALLCAQKFYLFQDLLYRLFGKIFYAGFFEHIFNRESAALFCRALLSLRSPILQDRRQTSQGFPDNQIYAYSGFPHVVAISYGELVAVKLDTGYFSYSL